VQNTFGLALRRLGTAFQSTVVANNLPVTRLEFTRPIFTKTPIAPRLSVVPMVASVATVAFLCCINQDNQDNQDKRIRNSITWYFLYLIIPLAANKYSKCKNNLTRRRKDAKKIR
jgi:hypothetical protein